jgi:hypothetical protein
MPRQSANGVYRTEPSAASPLARPAMAAAPAPSRARARAEPPAQASGSGNAFGVFDEAQMDVLAAILGETQGIAEKQLRDAIKALREEQQIEIGLVREELMGRMDAKLFGSTLIDDAGEIAKKAVAEFRREIESRTTGLGAVLTALGERLDAFEREAKKRELDTWRGLTSQVGRTFARVKDLESKASALAAQLDVIGTELRQLRHDLGDDAAKPWAPLALPAPSA